MVCTVSNRKSDLRFAIDSQIAIAMKSCDFQEPLNGLFLNGLFSRQFSRGKTAHKAFGEMTHEGPKMAHQGSENSPLTLATLGQ